MKYGEVFYARAWLLSKKFVVARFRIDPVPFVHKENGNHFRCWYKLPKTTQERRQFYGNEEYVRGRRKPLSLPNAYDDYRRSDSYDRRSWKKNHKCLKQWMIHYEK